MRKVDIVLTHTEKETKQIDFAETEEYILIHLDKFPTNTTLNFLYTDSKGNTTKTPLYAQKFIRLTKGHYDKLTIGNSLIQGQEIHGEAYIGSWLEILLFDVNQNLDGLYQATQETGRLYFTIGDNRGSHLSVTDTLDGDYRINIVLTIPPTSSYDKSDIVSKDSYLAKLIELIYERICSNLSNDAFIEKQSKELTLGAHTHNFLLHY